MNNSDMPAMPVMDESGWGHHYGLTKREYFMAHCAVDSDIVTFNTKDALMDFIGRNVDFDSVEDVTLAQAQALAKTKRMQVDADLAELERNK